MYTCTITLSTGYALFSTSFFIVSIIIYILNWLKIKVKTFKCLGSLLTNQNSIQEEIKCGLKAGNSCYYSVQTFLSSRLLSKNLKIKICKYKKIIWYCQLCYVVVKRWSLTLAEGKGIWKQDPEANIWAQEGWEWGVEKAPQWGIS